MQFENVIITKAGLAKLAQAVANNRLVFTDFEFTANDITLTDETTFIGNTWGNGHCDSAEWNGENYVIYMSASNQYSSGIARGFGVYGRLENETSNTLIFVANALGEPCVIEPTSGMHTRFHLAITLKYQVDRGAIIVDGRYAGLVSEEQFDKWKNRVVTTHTEASIYDGESQTILGRKIFADGIEINPGRGSGNGMSIYSSQEGVNRIVERSGRDTMYMEMNANNKTIEVKGNIVPNVDATYTLGSPDHRWLIYGVGMPRGVIEQRMDLASYETGAYPGELATTVKTMLGNALGIILYDRGRNFGDRRWQYILITDGELETTNAPMPTKRLGTRIKYSQTVLNVSGNFPNYVSSRNVEQTTWITTADFVEGGSEKLSILTLWHWVYNHGETPAQLMQRAQCYRLSGIYPHVAVESDSSFPINKDLILLQSVEIF